MREPMQPAKERIVTKAERCKGLHRNRRLKRAGAKKRYKHAGMQLAGVR